MHRSGCGGRRPESAKGKRIDYRVDCPLKDGKHGIIRGERELSRKARGDQSKRASGGAVEGMWRK